MPAAEMISGTIIGEIRIAMIAPRNGHVALAEADGGDGAERHGDQRRHRGDAEGVPQRVLPVGAGEEVVVVAQRVAGRVEATASPG